ncbi:RHS repeat-associated core domain-containing protein [Streptomyces sp. McG3]|uniref:RHS repeat-associated core domain-containing protein n=1 Tax=Streptomyces sp. McG3 TaxID=2725483 RepID=UPI0035A95483
MPVGSLGVAVGGEGDDAGQRQRIQAAQGVGDAYLAGQAGVVQADPNIGRFTTPDPSGQEQNPYLYAAGDPVNRIDLTGLFSFADGVGVVAGTAGVGCVAAGAVTAALWGAGAGGAGATIAGGTQAERKNGAIGGLLGGLSGPIGSAIFG